MSIRFLSLTAIALSFTVTLAACQPPAPTNGQPGRTVITDANAVGGPFTLVNQDGKTVTEADFKGKPQMIYFGFGYCPDICPTSLQRMGVTFDMLGKKASDVQPIFITIDPERDTAESLKLYITANGFPKNLTALTGTQDQIDAAAAEFRVYKKKVEDDGSAGGYTMDHSDILYFMDKDGVLINIFTARNSPADMAKQIKAHLKSAR